MPDGWNGTWFSSRPEAISARPYGPKGGLALRDPYGLSLSEAAVWASALAGLLSAGIVCAVIAARRPASPIIASPRWRDSVTTRSVAMAGV